MSKRGSIRLSEGQTLGTAVAVIRRSSLVRSDAIPTPYALDHSSSDFVGDSSSFGGAGKVASLANISLEPRRTQVRAKQLFPEERPSGYALKRSIDIAGSVVALVFFGPLMMIVALLLAVFDGGPVIFSQERIGFRGRKFRVLKFRTMCPRAVDALNDLLAGDHARSSEWAVRQKLAQDPRVTPLGKLLRLSSIDELPQLINVFRGDMSLVGPRPIVYGEHLRYGRYFDHYCDVRPGITGLWQVSGRNETTYRRRVALDVTYSRRVSLSLDLRILLMTIPAIFSAQGCY